MAATAVTGSTPDSCFRPPECEALPYSVQRMCLHQTQASEQYCHPGAATLQCTSYGRRYVGPPPCMLLLQVSPECGALVSPGQSTFGKLTTGTIPSSAATLIPRAARERRVSAVSPEAQFPSGQVSSFGAKGLQRLSTSRQSARTLMKARPEVNPIQKQWTDVGPGAYSPPSTCVWDAAARPCQAVERCLRGGSRLVVCVWRLPQLWRWEGRSRCAAEELEWITASCNGVRPSRASPTVRGARQVRADVAGFVSEGLARVRYTPLRGCCGRL